MKFFKIMKKNLIHFNKTPFFVFEENWDPKKWENWDQKKWSCINQVSKIPISGWNMLSCILTYSIQAKKKNF